MEDMALNNMGNECLVETLINLKESSLNAVESSKSLNELNKYMHVARPVQQEFEHIILSAYQSEKAELVLLCGSVGDGKSHLLSYYNDVMPEIMGKFYVHNDSTASYYKDKPAIFTLKEILQSFSDENIGMSKTKLILAINLGTLNNFLEADVGAEFSLLKHYISVNNILRDLVESREDDATSHFHCVNFADYHIYSLSEKSPQSFYINSLIEKITIEEENNPFFSAYRKCCQTCSSADKCPIKANYEMLSNKIYQNELVQLLIESIVKNKLIVSTRSLLNLIYELIVDERYIDIGSIEPRKDIEKLSALNYCKALMPNSMFSRKESSIVINSLSNIDPINVRNEKIDSFIVNFTNKDDVLKIFNDLPETLPLMHKFADICFDEFSSDPLKKELLKLFIRLSRLYDKEEFFETKDVNYLNFMRDLFFWNSGNKMKLRDIISVVRQGILLWNGYIDDDKMIVPVANTQVRYAISQKINIKQSLENITSKENMNKEKFSDTMSIYFETLPNKKSFKIDVDFVLYELLYRIANGYRPNMKDKSLNVKFDDFVSNISNTGMKEDVLYIQERSLGNCINYKLEFSEDFGYIFEVV